MKLPIYYVDAFTENLFSGNPAAVIFSDLNDSLLMQNIAAENNLSETAFIRKDEQKYYIRWFSPTCEIDLCGHATLASAFIFFNYIDETKDVFEVESIKNGTLKINKRDDYLYLDFPTDYIEENQDYDIVEKALGVKPVELYKGRDDILAIFDNESVIANLDPDFDNFEDIPVRGLITSAPGNDCDFVSRCFFPSSGVNEDPVTGSAHTSLTPYWSKRLDRKSLVAKQLSKRGGILYCEDHGDRIFIGGKAVQYMKGEISTG